VVNQSGVKGDLVDRQQGEVNPTTQCVLNIIVEMVESAVHGSNTISWSGTRKQWADHEFIKLSWVSLLGLLRHANPHTCSNNANRIPGSCGSKRLCTSKRESLAVPGLCLQVYPHPCEINILGKITIRQKPICLAHGTLNLEEQTP
jgi:hypothetical protein